MLRFIAVAIAAIIAAIVALFAPNDSGYCGGRSHGHSRYKNESNISKGSGTMSDYTPEIARVISARMREPLASAYRREFARVYMKTLPPVLQFDEIRGKLPYQTDTRVHRTSTHIGQRKLDCNERKFLLENTTEGVPAVMIYAGAAPSNHMGFLSNLFPDVKLILVDPNPFDITDVTRDDRSTPVYLHRKGDKMTAERAEMVIAQAAAGTSRIYLINDLMTLDIARAVAKIIPDHLFVSDIRTNSGERLVAPRRENGPSTTVRPVLNEEMPDALDILWNNAQQYNWMTIMKPRSSMLKFRHPFYTGDPKTFYEKARDEPYHSDFELAKTNGIDFIENFGSQILIYYDGVIDLQPWPGQSSTESRLITSGKTLRDWGTPKEYEDTYFYYNNILRTYALHENPNADRALGFDMCNDCAIENRIWETYLEKYPTRTRELDLTVKKLVRDLSAITHRPLLREDHGKLFARDDRALLAALSRHDAVPHRMKK